MYFCESCWKIFSISLYIVSDINFPLLFFNECNLLFWHRSFFINKICHVFWCFVHFYLCFSIGFIVRNSFSPSSCNQNGFPPFLLPSRLIFKIRTTCLYFIINFLSNPKITSKDLLIFNNFLHMSDFGHSCEFLKRLELCFVRWLVLVETTNNISVDPAIFFFSFFVCLWVSL